MGVRVYKVHALPVVHMDVLTIVMARLCASIMVVSGRAMEGFKHYFTGQNMAPLIASQTVPALVFPKMGPDLFGPVVVKKKGRAKTT